MNAQPHCDQRIHLQLAHARDTESEHAFDRPWLLLGDDKQTQVYVFSNVPLTVIVDYVWNWKLQQAAVSIW